MAALDAPQDLIAFDSGSALTLFDAARKALSEAKSVDELRDVRNTADRLKLYAKQAKDQALACDALDIRDMATRRIGEMLKKQPKAPAGRPRKIGAENAPILDAPITYAEAGIDKHLAKDARKLWHLDEADFLRRMEERREDIARKTSLFDTSPRGGKGTGENGWYTPAEDVERVRRVLGTIDLDPASSKIAQKTVKAGRFFTEKQDGLKQEWRGNVFLNPPFAKQIIDAFADKFCLEWKAARIPQAILLTHNFTDTRWFRALADLSAAICFTRGRIAFVSPERDQIAAPTQGQAFFYFGENIEGFRHEFERVGFIVAVLR